MATSCANFLVNTAGLSTSKYSTPFGNLLHMLVIKVALLVPVSPTSLSNLFPGYNDTGIFMWNMWPTSHFHLIEHNRVKLLGLELHIIMHPNTTMDIP